MISDRKNLWTEIQEKMIKFLEYTKYHILELNIQALYDFLMLSNIFLEIGLEFSGDTDSKCSLKTYISNVIIPMYINEFNQKALTSLRNIIEKETWDGLRLPENFRLREISEPMSDYPPHEILNKSLSIFRN
jgi:hypothetical protein